MWIVHSLHPLTPEELETAIELEEVMYESSKKTLCFDIMEEVEKCFGPLFILANGEICLGHPLLREILSCPDVQPKDGNP